MAVRTLRLNLNIDLDYQFFDNGIHMIIIYIYLYISIYHDVRLVNLNELGLHSPTLQLRMASKSSTEKAGVSIFKFQWKNK